jgi:hypothetical protein
MSPDFDGKTYSATIDRERLTAQLARTRDCMADGQWRTLEEISGRIGAPPASVSARLRDLRKQKFGGYTVNRRGRNMIRGLFEYQVVPGETVWGNQFDEMEKTA